MREPGWLMSATLLLCMFAWVPSVSAAADAARSSCPTIRLSGGVGSAEERALVCDAAARARGFFRELGIELNQPVRLRLHQTEIAGRSLHLGSYDARLDQVDLLTFEQAQRLTTGDALFGRRMDEPLYRSLVVHEVAHAIAGQHFGYRPVSPVAQEYIAYVAQLSTVDPAIRAEILQAYDLEAFSGVEEMSLTFYALNPSGFGVKAWLHYQGLADRAGFVRDVLAGAIRPQAWEVEWP